LIVTLHWAPLSSSQPVQVTPAVPVPSEAASITGVPSSKLFSQLEPQLIPPGELVTVPVPEPLAFTVSVCCPIASKVAVTRRAGPRRSSQSPVEPLPLSQRLRSPALAPASGAPASLTGAPSAKLASQVGPKLMPAGELVTVPPPVSALVTSSRSWGTRSYV